MALLVKTNSGGNHFLKGNVLPDLENFGADFWTPIDFFGERIMVRVSEVESVSVQADADVQQIMSRLGKGVSRLAH